jgi:hypothetical protein
VFLNLKKNNNKQSLKIDPGTQKKLGMLNVIKQLQHSILCNMMCYGAPKSNIDCGLRQYCFSVLHNTSYRTQWSAVIVWYWSTIHINWSVLLLYFRLHDVLCTILHKMECCNCFITFNTPSLLVNLDRYIGIVCCFICSNSKVPHELIHLIS